MTDWKRAVGPILCPLAACGHIARSPGALSSHLARLHPALGRRGRSLLLDKVRRDIGWPVVRSSGVVLMAPKEA